MHAERTEPTAARPARCYARSTSRGHAGPGRSPSRLLLAPGQVVTFQERIHRDPGICGGQPVIRGTRVLVRTILGYLAHGEPVSTILREFPSLTEEDVRAVIAFAAASASEDLPAPSPIPPVVEVV